MRRARPPQSRPGWPFTINRSSPQARGLVAWYPLSSVDVATNLASACLFDVAQSAQARAATSRWVAQPREPGWVVTRATVVTPNRGMALSNETTLASIPTTYAFAVFVRAAATAFAQTAAVIGFGGTDDLLLYPYDDDAAGDGPRVFWRDLGGTIINIDTSLPAADGKYHDFCFVSYASNDHRLFIDGVQVATSAATGTAGPFDSVRLMGWADSDQGFHGSAYDFRIYDRAPSPALIAAMTDPRTRWDLYQVPQRRAWQASALSGGITLEDLTLGVERSFAVNVNPALGGRGFH